MNSTFCLIYMSYFFLHPICILNSCVQNFVRPFELNLEYFHSDCLPRKHHSLSYFFLDINDKFIDTRLFDSWSHRPFLFCRSRSALSAPLSGTFISGQVTRTFLESLVFVSRGKVTPAVNALGDIQKEISLGCLVSFKCRHRETFCRKLHEGPCW